ncbi:MAG: S8 family serine peptidase [Sedimentisphaerales bacterium]
MKRAILLNFAVLLVIAALVPAVSGQNCDGYVLNEIIIKLRERQQGLQALARELTLPQSLVELNARYNVREIKPLLKNLQQKHQRLTSLHTESKTLLTQKQKHILRRLKRAPKDAVAADLSRIYKIKLDCEPGQSLQEVVQAYQNNPNVEYAELNYIVSIDLTADDPFYRSQWSLQTIDAPQAWDISTGSSQIVVAVVDTGVDYSHRDLQPNMWVNEAELNGINGQDDDRNGYVDDIYGYNFIYNNSDPADDHGHGTHVAGIIAAKGNNALDIAGICWSAKIMALKFLGLRGEGTTADAVLALYYAVENGADIISNSWGSNSESNALKDAIDYAHSRGVILVAAAGNDNSNSPYYPAGYEHVISVTATDTGDNKWPLSNYGDWVDIAAPGADILSLRAEGTSQGVSHNPSTAVLSGTSMAAPHVTGACALLLSVNPLLPYNELHETLVRTIDPISRGICRSNGRLNLSQAVHAVIPAQGYINLDRDTYTFGSPVNILLADWDLRGRGSQEVTLTTTRGDSETIILTETPLTFGVFTGTISLGPGEPNIEDGIVQVSTDDGLTVIYFDADDGNGNPVMATDEAVTDFEPPEVLDVQVQTRGPVAEMSFTTNEPTAAKVYWGTTCGPPTADLTFVKEDIVMSIYHTIKLYGLSLKTSYYFVIELLDAAGNRITADSGGLCYSFTTAAEFTGFHVPSIYPTIQAAINDAQDGDTVWVADGRYIGEGNYELDFKGKAITVRSENGPENCIIDCQRYGRGFHFHNAEDANSVLDGFTIKNGYAERFGGGIRCTASSPTIINCIVTRNSAKDYGGGMYNCYNSNPTIIDCTFRANSSESLSILGNGGGMANYSNSSPTIINCSFVGNSVSYSGGGMYNHKNSNPVITNCIFRDNSAGRSGGAMSNWHSSSPILTNCSFNWNRSADGGGGMCNYYNSNPIIKNTIFSHNSAEKFGGGIKNYESSPSLLNCTISANRAEFTGGIWNGPGSGSQLSNCILWANSDSAGMDESAQILFCEAELRCAARGSSNDETSVEIPAGQGPINYCCIQGWTGRLGGIGNMVAEPYFVDAENEDYHLKSEAWRWDNERGRWHYDELTSPCIDAGNPGSALEDELLTVPDDPNNLWGVNLRINMGAYGGTDQASMPPPGASLLADITNDGLVNMKDFAAQALYWMTAQSRQPGDLNRDGLVDSADLILLAEDWLKQTPLGVLRSSGASGHLTPQVLHPSVSLRYR